MGLRATARSRRTAFAGHPPRRKSAESGDGLHWRRGEHEDDNLQLAPHGQGWESQMVEYPTLIRDGQGLRLFYCGNGYGRTGIGAAYCPDAGPLAPSRRADPQADAR